MFRRRRKRSRGTWFPITGAGYVFNENNFNTWNAQGFLNFASANDAELIGLGPLVWDAPLREDNITPGDPDTGHQLVDFVGNEYVLQRIVGESFINLETSGTEVPTGPEAVQVTLAFFVARSGDFNDTASEDKPIGAAGATEAELYGPDHLATAREPWIWRRKWILGNLAQPGTTIANAGIFPPTNVAYGGGVADGGHIDSKVKRRIGNDDRLWYVISAKPYPLGDNWTLTTATTFGVRYALDLRIFGSLRRARGKSAF